MNKREFTWKSKRTIEWIPITEELAAYRSEVSTGYRKTSYEGVTSLKVIESVKEDANIPHYELRINKDVRPTIHLCLPELRDIFRNNAYGTDEYNNGICSCVLKRPYTHLLEGKKAELLAPCTYDGHLYDLDHKILPEAARFSYMNGHMHNGNYDLRNALEILKQRTDIVWRDDQTGKVGEAKILEIPYYNREPDRTEFLCFDWTPSDEDWERVKGTKDRFDFADKIVKEIFHIRKKKGTRTY